MRLLIDIDDVVTETAAEVARRLQVDPVAFIAHPTRFGWLHHPEVDDDRLFQEYQRVLPSHDLPIVEGAATALMRARGAGFGIEFISARYARLTTWSKMHLWVAGVLHEECGDLLYCLGTNKPAYLERANSDDLLIDDQEPLNCNWIAFERPWNQATRGRAVASLASWSQLMTILAAYKEAI